MKGRVRKIALLGSAIALLLGCAAADSDSGGLEGLTIVRADASDVPIAGLAPEWRQRFERGDALFEAVFRDAQGLGPLYIRHRCASCHAEDGRGPGSVLKIALLGQDGLPLEDQSGLRFGPTIRPHTAGGAEQALTVPEAQDDLMLTTRFGPAAFGRGYLEAILDSEVERLEAEQSSGSDGISGRINRVPYASEENPEQPFHTYAPGQPGLIGRFGLKARIATVDDFTAEAFVGDMGITSPLRPDELPSPAGDEDALPGVDIDAEAVNLVADYVRMLRIPPRLAAAQDPGASALFAELGCATCHVPSLRTRPDYPIDVIAATDAPVYTDLLVHDMGPAFNDGLREHDASGSEWRTAPLIGLRHIRNYLHDGRAGSIAEAIIAHGGEGSEAAAAVRRFTQLEDSERDALLAFVSAL
jgi:CxxC motif-containing protein (DUF1111 family)